MTATMWPDPDECASDGRRQADDDKSAKAVVPSGRWCSDVEGEPPDEGPDEAAVESDGDGPDDREDEDEVRLGIAHPKVSARSSTSTMAVTVAPIAATSRVMDDPILGEWPGSRPSIARDVDDRWRR